VLTPDIINGVFEAGMAAVLFRSVLRLRREKKVSGWSPWAVVWPTLWGFWNLYFYPHLGQFWSFVGGLLVVVTNMTWLGLAAYYASTWHKRATRLASDRGR
jgi:hypothetical protein